MFERILKDALLKHLRSNNILNPYQHATFPGGSCISNRLAVMGSFSKAHGEGQVTYAVFIDLDGIPQIPPLRILRAVVLWSLLNGRILTTGVGSAYSQSAPVTEEVPQWSMLGP